MRLMLAAVAFAAAAGGARADIPAFDATCPGGLGVRAEEGGPVTIGGAAAEIVGESKYAFEARLDGMSVAVTIKPDASLGVSFTGADGTTGICLVGSADPVAHDEQL